MNFIFKLRKLLRVALQIWFLQLPKEKGKRAPDWPLVQTSMEVVTDK